MFQEKASPSIWCCQKGWTGCWTLLFLDHASSEGGKEKMLLGENKNKNPSLSPLQSFLPSGKGSPPRPACLFLLLLFSFRP